MGRLYTKNGVIYQLAQWYPRMCVYDDVTGWNTLPYIGLGEFYCEYGNYDYYITAPSEMIVTASGDLQNPKQVLTGKEISRLNEARKSDSTVSIISEMRLAKHLQGLFKTACSHGILKCTTQEMYHGQHQKHLFGMQHELIFHLAEKGFRWLSIL